MKKYLVAFIILSFLGFDSNFTFSIPSTAFSNGRYGVSNSGNSFIKKISKKYNLKERVRKIKIKGKKNKTYILKEYVNIKSHLVIWFQKDWTKPNESVLNNIHILSRNKNKAISVANYFINSSKAKKKHRKKWKNYIKKVSFESKPAKFLEYSGVPSLRCLTHKIYNSKHKKNAYYLELNIVE